MKQKYLPKKESLKWNSFWRADCLASETSATSWSIPDNSYAIIWKEDATWANWNTFITFWVQAFAFIDFSGYRYQIRHRATLGNQYTDELIPCHLRGIEIQYAIMERFTADGRLLSVDKGNYALFTVKWILTCLFSYSGLSKSAIMEKMAMVLDNELVHDHVKNSAPSALPDKVLRKLICGKNSQCIYWLYKVFK